MLSIINLKTGREEHTGLFSSVLCLGNFDGVHTGHTELIRRTLARRDELSGAVSGILGGAWCFRQPPADFLSENPRIHLTTLDEKLEMFANLGLDIAVLGDFSKLRNLSPRVFAEKVLKRSCGCLSAVCGFNFRYGKNGSGTPADLSKAFGSNLTVVSPVTLDGVTVSSSEIRRLILCGDVTTAAKLLGREYSFSSSVVHGQRLGRKLGVPTINQYFPTGKILPLCGVYAGYAEFNGRSYQSVINVGSNPTVSENSKIRCETHILGFDGELYGQSVGIRFSKFLRGEQKFDSLDTLKTAILHDIEAATAYFGQN